MHDRPSQLSRALHLLFTKEWHNGLGPAEWQDRILLSLYKLKGSRPECSNYCPITLPLLSSKFSPTYSSTAYNHSLTKLRLQQSEFTARRSTIDAMLTLHLLEQLHQTYQQPLNIEFIGIKSAFNLVSHQVLWKALHGAGTPSFSAT